MDIDKLYNLIEAHYGYKADMQYIDAEKKELTFWLYNSFLVKCSLEERYNSFGVGITFGNQESTITEFLGERCSLNSDEESIKQSLLIVENYCRLRLPDKFLKAFEEAYNLLFIHKNTSNPPGIPIIVEGPCITTNKIKNP